MITESRTQGIPTFASRVRGLMLGLALGDAVGSKGSDVPPSGVLDAGVATQLAAWTAEGLLRTATRFGGRVLENHQQVVHHAYARWADPRLTRPLGGGRQEGVYGPGPDRGWLADVLAMSEVRGSSPATLRAIEAGRPTSSAGCQGLLRCLPVAAICDPRQAAAPASLAEVVRYARELCALTHQGPYVRRATGIATHIILGCLHATGPIGDVIRQAIGDHTLRVPQAIVDCDRLGRSEPCVPEILERIAPDRTALAALAGGVYVARSFPEADTCADALKFAGWAPDGDSVAAVAGAFLGAVHGYEALPVGLTSRLELGWVMDRLAIALARQAQENQAGTGWKADIVEPGVDPWWDSKYPGV